MPRQTKVCRVCGESYASCRTVKTGSGVFNWREMCCSPECGKIYFQRIEEARNPAPKVKVRKPITRREIAVKETPTVSDSIHGVEQAEQPVEEPEKK